MIGRAQAYILTSAINIGTLSVLFGIQIVYINLYTWIRKGIRHACKYDYVYVNISWCKLMNKYIVICKHVQIHTEIHVYIYIYNIYIYLYIYIYMHIYMSIQIHEYICTHMYNLAYIYIFIYIHICIYICI
jgi:hypothetical protein